ncbi:MAG TPA: alternative ribosome rescue aminoacyl-tRNA hydrolase ArfB [Steroidobacteraceae bacterium]|nr:alternative ribosome rescue aminoacyl-tRNA hydrolase ArfB [Steroidobacteraceae bacterium]
MAVCAGVTIPDREIELAFVRSSGPGGQNVNKLATAVQLRFDLAGSAALGPDVKMRLRNLSGRRVTADGTLLIVARTHRTQEQNRRAVEERLADLIRRALRAPKPRRPTEPPRASRERRLERKARLQRTKRLRARPRWDE